MIDDNFVREQESLARESSAWRKVALAKEKHIMIAGGRGRTQMWRESEGEQRASVYEGELEAVYRALLIPPVGWDVELYVDSQSVIDQMRGSDERYRRWVKTPERQLVSMCRRLIKQKGEKGAQVMFTKVESHIEGRSMDLKEAANDIDLADAVAKQSRLHGDENKDCLWRGEVNKGYSILFKGRRDRGNPWARIEREVLVQMRLFDRWKTKSRSQKGVALFTSLYECRSFVQSLKQEGVDMGTILLVASAAMYATKRSASISVPSMSCERCKRRGVIRELNEDHLWSCTVNRRGDEKIVERIAHEIELKWYPQREELEKNDEDQRRIEAWKKEHVKEFLDMTDTKRRQDGSGKGIVREEQLDAAIQRCIRMGKGSRGRILAHLKGAMKVKGRKGKTLRRRKRLPRGARRLIEALDINADPRASPFESCRAIKKFCTNRKTSATFFGGSYSEDTHPEGWLQGKRSVMNLMQGGDEAREDLKWAVKELSGGEGSTCVLAFVKAEEETQVLLDSESEGRLQKVASLKTRGRETWIVLGRSTEECWGNQKPHTMTIVEMIASMGRKGVEVQVSPWNCGIACKAAEADVEGWTRARWLHFKTLWGSAKVSTYTKLWGVWTEARRAELAKGGFRWRRKDMEMATRLVFRARWQEWEKRHPQRKGYRLMDSTGIG